MARRGHSAQKTQDSLIALSSARARRPGAAGGVTVVTGSAPIVISGPAATPNVGITPATDLAAGSMSAADKAKLDALAPGDVTSVTASFPLTSSGGATPNLAPANNQTLVAIVPNAAALALLALPATGVASVYVQSYGAYFNLAPAASTPLQPSVVLPSSNLGFVWQRAYSGIAAQAIAQAAWFVNAAAGSDENNGLTPGTAVQHKAEIARRWGTWRPTLNATQVVVTFITADAVAGDPWLAQPLYTNGATLLLFAALPAPAFTGTLLAVTPKVVGPAGNLIRSTFTVTTGAVAANMLLINATRANSRAFAQRNLGGGNWQLSQPVTPFAPLGFPEQTSVDTWANGDAISGYTLLSVEIGIVGGQAVDLPATFAPNVQVQQIRFSALASTLFLDLDSQFAIVDCDATATTTVLRGTPVGLPNQSANTAFGIKLGANGGSQGRSLLYSAGYCLGANFVGAGFINGFYIPSSQTCGTTAFTDYAGLPTDISVDAAAILNFIGQVDSLAVATRIWGAGAINVKGNLTYVGLESTMFQIATMQLLGKTSGYSNVTVGTTTIHNVALTPANLAAAAGAAGFGHFAWGGGGHIAQVGAQP